MLIAGITIRLSMNRKSVSGEMTYMWHIPSNPFSSASLKVITLPVVVVMMFGFGHPCKTEKDIIQRWAKHNQPLNHISAERLSESMNWFLARDAFVERIVALLS